jgi:DNA (cytosine-5)-methyltransferase 1
MENNREGFSFPDKMSDGQKYKQFGNSVSIPVIRKMADFMLQCFRTLEEQQVDIVKAMAERKEYITKRDIMEELEISGTQASGILKRMICVNEIKRVSCGRTTRYVCADSINKLNSYSQTKIIIDETAKRGSISNRDVVAVLGGSIAGANNMLSQMTKKGLLVRQSRGKYVLHSIS